MGHYKVMEHTADAGIQVDALSLQDLFQTAATGMFHIICPHGLVARTETHAIRVDGEDIAELLVNWLSELNYLFQVQQFLFSNVIDFIMTRESLATQVTGERIDSLRHSIHTEIKAITYHKIMAHQSPSGNWQALLYFDL